MKRCRWCGHLARLMAPVSGGLGWQCLDVEACNERCDEQGGPRDRLGDP